MKTFSAYAWQLPYLDRHLGQILGHGAEHRIICEHSPNKHTHKMNWIEWKPLQSVPGNLKFNQFCSPPGGQTFSQGAENGKFSEHSPN